MIAQYTLLCSANAAPILFAVNCFLARTHWFTILAHHLRIAHHREHGIGIIHRILAQDEAFGFHTELMLPLPVQPLSCFWPRGQVPATAQATAQPIAVR